MVAMPDNGARRGRSSEQVGVRETLRREMDEEGWIGVCKGPLTLHLEGEGARRRGMEEEGTRSHAPARIGRRGIRTETEREGSMWRRRAAVGRGGRKKAARVFFWPARLGVRVRIFAEGHVREGLGIERAEGGRLREKGVGWKKHVHIVLIFFFLLSFLFSFLSFFSSFPF